MGNRIIHLVRHGKYSLDTAEGEEPDGRLTELGRKQAELVANYLASRPIDVIIHSSLIRAKETAVIISKKFPNVPIHSKDLLRECFPSIPAGLEAHFAAFSKEFIEAGAIQAQEAFTHFFKPIGEKEPDREELLVAHGNIINSFIVRALNAPLDQWVYLDPFHCSHCQVVVLASGKMKLVHYNNSGYLPTEQRTI